MEKISRSKEFLASLEPLPDERTKKQRLADLKEKNAYLLKVKRELRLKEARSNESAKRVIIT